ncbi:hypothetical protein JVT61DRAFT_14841 [Boletus reticuloceps]|uniref:Uncharacterized protein n=1 Tax=Boletus reticuloceps TaxID=495285 RepID=A0A8I3A2X4_9AGAM|nr:hypothetical protein JVT61DRAFT_14841 [Boletus reticuloceps]
MLLTTIELWVALDKIALKEIPMLTDYSPEVPTSLLEDLLLCKTASLLPSSPSPRIPLSLPLPVEQLVVGVFSDNHCEHLWCPLLQRISSLQSLKSRIEKAVQQEVDEKVDELENENARYAELKHEAANIEHKFGVNRRGYEYHDNNCYKCALERELST